MAGKADAAHEKERRREQTTAAEYAEMARLAAEMTPTAQEVEIMRQAQEAQQYAPTPQDIQAAQVAAEAQTALQEELGDMAIYGEQLKKAMEAAAQVSEIVKNAGFAAGKLTEAVRSAITQTYEILTPAVTAINENAEKLREFLSLMEVLRPYMEAEYTEHPEIYGDDEHPEIGVDVPLGELVAAAARRARADGKDIPPLKAEEPESGETTEQKGVKSDILAQLESLPLFQSFLPAMHTSPNSRLANSLQGENSIINAGERDFIVANRGKRNETTIYTMVSYDAGDGVQLTGRTVTEYDRQIYDAICSIWEYGHESRMFTPDTVYRAMTGTDSQPSPQQRGAITKSIDKWRRILGKVDATAEITAYLKRKRMEPEPGTVFKWGDAMLSVRELEAKQGKNKQTVYKLNSEPLLLSYSRATGKLLTAPTALLDVKELTADGQPTGPSIANTEGRIALKGYLWRRVLIMKHDIKDAQGRYRYYENERKRKPELPAKPLKSFFKQSHCILFETLFEATEQTTPNRELQRRNRDYVFQVLDYWKAVGHIAGYKKQTGKRGAITGFEILF